MKKYLFAIVTIGVLAVGWGTLRPAAQMTPPTAPQTSNPRSASGLIDVNIPTLQGAEIMGKRAYDAKCAACHGANGAGQDGIAPPFIHIIYEPNHHGDIAFQMAVQNGVRAHHWPFGDMPPVTGLTQDDVGNIVAYIRALQRANGID